MQPNPQQNVTLKVIALALAGLGLLGLGALLFVYLMPSSADAAGEPTEYASAIPAAVNYPAPRLALHDLSGTSQALEDYRGKTVLVNHWAFWCGPCRAELPELLAYYTAHRHQNFTIIGIESGGEFEDVDWHVKEYGLTFPIWLDPEGDGLTAFKTQSLPSSFVIDPNGQVVLAWAGPVKRQVLEQFVTPLLEK